MIESQSNQTHNCNFFRFFSVVYDLQVICYKYTVDIYCVDIFAMKFEMRRAPNDENVVEIGMKQGGSCEHGYYLVPSRIWVQFIANEENFKI
jgi:hypothetical protein